MQLRRIVLALALAATVGLTAACAQDSGSTAQGAASASSGASSGASGGASSGTSGAAASASPSVDLKANTEAVCKGVVAAYDKEKAELLAVLGEVLSASAGEDKTALAAAKAKGEVVLGRLTKAVDAELANAADPQAKAALGQFVATFAKLLTAQKVDDPAFEAEMDKAADAAAKYCPALTA